MNGWSCNGWNYSGWNGVGWNVLTPFCKTAQQCTEAIRDWCLIEVCGWHLDNVSELEEQIIIVNFKTNNYMRTNSVFDKNIHLVQPVQIGRQSFVFHRQTFLLLILKILQLVWDLNRKQQAAREKNLKLNVWCISTRNSMKNNFSWSQSQPKPKKLRTAKVSRTLNAQNNCQAESFNISFFFWKNCAETWCFWFTLR